jgi:plasmid stabilization system protein ParE
MKVFWSEMAEKDFENNILYLINNWDEHVTQQFTFELERVLTIIRINPETFQYDQIVKCHIVPITKHITLFYEVHANEELVILRLWNNYQHPNKFVTKTKK